MRPEGLLTERSTLICFPSEKGEKYWVRKPDGELEKKKKALLRLLPWVKGSLSTAGFMWLLPSLFITKHIFQRSKGNFIS